MYRHLDSRPNRNNAQVSILKVLLTKTTGPNAAIGYMFL